jgi:hypothetical protein
VPLHGIATSQFYTWQEQARVSRREAWEAYYAAGPDRSLSDPWRQSFISEAGCLEGSWAEHMSFPKSPAYRLGHGPTMHPAAKSILRCKLLWRRTPILGHGLRHDGQVLLRLRSPLIKLAF